METSDFRPEVGARFRLKTQHLARSGWIEAAVGLSTAGATARERDELGGGTRLRLTHEGEIDPVVGGLLREGWPSRIELLRRSL